MDGIEVEVVADAAALGRRWRVQRHWSSDGGGRCSGINVVVAGAAALTRRRQMQRH